jgi:quercetin dioxygenase-like cupin family protein
MRVHKLLYPQTGEGFLKEIIHISQSGTTCTIGTFFMKAGERITEQGLKSHPEHEISLIQEGSIKAITQNEEIILKQGDVVNFSANELHTGEVIQDCKLLWILVG